MLNVIQANWPAPKNICAFTTTRIGGVSLAPYAHFNLATHVHDNERLVAHNRELLKSSFNLPAEPTWLTQVHGINVVNAQTYATPPQADASYTAAKQQVCAVLTADCLPILICDEAGTQVAAIHAGWRGLVAGIIEKTLQNFSAPAAELLVWLGPAIGPTVFEVGVEVRDKFIAYDPAAAAAFKNSRPGHWLADLYLLAKQRFAQQGIFAIFGGKHCTYSETEYFYSYRRDGDQTGRMASLIWLAQFNALLNQPDDA